MKNYATETDCHPPEMTGIGGAVPYRAYNAEMQSETDKSHITNKPYILHDIPADLEQSWKARAVQDGCTKRDVLFSALMEYLK